MNVPMFEAFPHLTRDDFPALHPTVYQTPHQHTQYLREPGVVLLSKPQVNISELYSFIMPFTSEEAADDYVSDTKGLTDGEKLVKTAGQLCYLAFGSNRTRAKDAKRYFDNLKSSGHGSVFEHANYTFLFYGIDRAVTHELVRHRAGFGFSQVSQRYVDGAMLRFVEDPEHAEDAELHAKFEAWIDMAREQYDIRAEQLRKRYEAEGLLDSLSKTDARKVVNQAARRCLPNETEAPIIVTGNVRAWRNFLDQRATIHADRSIRAVAFIAGLILHHVAPLFFDDYEINGDEKTLTTKYRKV